MTDEKFRKLSGMFDKTDSQFFHPGPESTGVSTEQFSRPVFSADLTFGFCKNMNDILLFHLFKSNQFIVDAFSPFTHFRIQVQQNIFIRDYINL